jgi:hypothetical protein
VSAIAPPADLARDDLAPVKERLRIFFIQKLQKSSRTTCYLRRLGRIEYRSFVLDGIE